MSNTRRQANRQLLAILSNYVETYSDARFTQILVSLGINERILDRRDIDCGSIIIDNIYEESVETLERVKKELEVL